MLAGVKCDDLAVRIQRSAGTNLQQTRHHIDFLRANFRQALLKIFVPAEMISEVDVWRIGRASDEEALKLVVAYLTINEPERRREVLALAEKYASQTVPPVPQDNFDRK